MREHRERFGSDSEDEPEEVYSWFLVGLTLIAALN